MPMPRKGEQLERWAREHIRGEATVNSGAVHEDADMKVDGVGGRVYEFKSSVTTKGLSINRMAIMTLLQRSLKLNREPVFVYQNANGDKFAAVPLKVLSNAVEKWDAHGFMPDEISAVKHAISMAPMIKSKGNNMRIPERDLKDAIENAGVLMFQTKNTIMWVILEVNTWLVIAGDKAR